MAGAISLRYAGIYPENVRQDRPPSKALAHRQKK